MPIRLEAGAEPVLNYMLVRRLGQGGFGEVWEAIAPGRVRVALKFIRLNTAQAIPELRAFEIIRDIRHPHLLDMQFAVQKEDYLVIAMPLCDQSLKDRLEECREQGLPGLSKAELIGYMNEIADAVDFLNETRHRSSDGDLVGVQHRDIKPQNIFLVGGSARLADFGMAKVLETSTAGHSGAMTPHYAAPELIDGRVSSRSDQYSLAVTYIHLRTGELPFRGSISAVLSGHLHGEPDLARLPEAERAVIARALAKRPEERWSSCREMVQRLAAWDTGRPSVGPRAGSGVPRPTDDDARPSHRGFSAVPNLDLSSTWDHRADLTPSWMVTTEPDGAGAHPSLDTTEHQKNDAPTGRLWGVAACLAVLLLMVFGSGTSRVAPDDHPRDVIPGVLVPEDATDVALELAGNEIPDPPSPTGEPRLEFAALERSAIDGAEPDLAAKAVSFLKTYCYKCHGGEQFEVEGYDVLKREVLVAPREGEDRPYVTPGDPEKSKMWVRAGVKKNMPPKSEPKKPTDAERTFLRDWIKAGAPFPAVATVARRTLAEKDILATIRDDLRAADEADRPFRRYLTLHNLHNASYGEPELRQARAAVAKLLNSLSWESEIVVPKSIGQEGVVLAFDLRNVGWDRRDLWKVLLARYPYGLTHNKDRDPALRSLANDVAGLAGVSLPFVRADWFVATASRPPLYHDLLGLPDNAPALEMMLKVDTDADFLRDRLARAGFVQSGVSSHNRLVDRHPALYGAYWKSYDFRRDDGPANLFRFPLGPVFTANPFPNQAFEHAGGELIFNLPNGMQGYLLVDAKGKRIDIGPPDVVADSRGTSGTREVVNGLSCMGCHDQGMKRFTDTVRDGLGVAGSAGEKAERLFRKQDELNDLLTRDERRFLKAVEEATGPFLKVGEDAANPIRDFPDPVGTLAVSYQKALGAAEVAADLGLADPKDLLGAIRANANLRRLGLAPLLNGATIKRSDWDSLDGRILSTFHEAARELELGTPYRVF
jgi:serine/threonine protein kinase